MALITLTTDWRKSDYYIGAIKGKILSHDASTVVVDINHLVAPYNMMQAAFILRNCYFYFPAGTVHIVGVNPVLSRKSSLLILEKEGHYFLCSDTGFPGLIFPDQNVKVYRLNLTKTPVHSLESLDFFVDAAFKLIAGEAPADFAEETSKYILQLPLRPVIDNRLINGNVVYVDSYSNAITNISRETFSRVGDGMDFKIYVQSNHYVIDKISHSYQEVASGELLALFNSADLLEIAISNAPAAELLNLDVNSTIRVKFAHATQSNKLLLSGE